jgi:hypothetical protein
LNYPKRAFPGSNFLKKYGCEVFEERKNFLHRNFFRFEMDLELKIWEDKVCF